MSERWTEGEIVAAHRAYEREGACFGAALTAADELRDKRRRPVVCPRCKGTAGSRVCYCGEPTGDHSIFTTHSVYEMPCPDCAHTPHPGVVWEEVES